MYFISPEPDPAGHGDVQAADRHDQGRDDQRNDQTLEHLEEEDAGKPDVVCLKKKKEDLNKIKQLLTHNTFVKLTLTCSDLLKPSETAIPPCS